MLINDYLRRLQSVNYANATSMLLENPDAELAPLPGPFPGTLLDSLDDHTRGRKEALLLQPLGQPSPDGPANQPDSSSKSEGGVVKCACGEVMDAQNCDGVDVLACGNPDCPSGGVFHRACAGVAAGAGALGTTHWLCPACDSNLKDRAGSSASVASQQLQQLCMDDALNGLLSLGGVEDGSYILAALATAPAPSGEHHSR